MATEVLVGTRAGGKQKKSCIVYSREEAEAIGLAFCLDWRDGEEGDWVLTEDGFVVKVLRTGRMRRGDKWMRTAHGTYLASTGRMTTEKRDSRYTFTGRRAQHEFKMNARIKAWAALVVVGHNPLSTYMDVFTCDSRKWAERRVVFLLKRPEVIEYMRSELRPILARLGITEEFVIKGYLKIFEDGDSDNVKFKALNELAYLTGVKEEPGKPSPGDGFLGFGTVLDELAEGQKQVAASPQQDHDDAPTLESLEDRNEP